MAAAVGLFLAATGVVTLTSPQAVAATCTAGTTSDFNGDGVGDTVVGDPGATVNGAKKAGLVRVVLGGGKGVSEISQATTGMPAAPETGDGFGTAVASYDADGDGCSDLVVGTPYEDVLKDGKNLVDAGAIYVIHGTPTGIGAGSRIEGYSQAGFNPTSGTEAYDWFGYSLKAGTTASGTPYLVIGVPGEGVTVSGKTYAHAGCVEYAQGTTKLAVSQDSAGVPGVPEEDDRFGYSLAGTNRYFAVGTPGEAIGDQHFAGGVAVFSHTLANGMPTPLLGLDQDSSGIPGVAESGDGFGTSISMTGYRPSDQTYNSDVLLAIGMPGEDVGTLADAGGVAVVRIQPSGAYSLVTAMDGSTADLEGDAVAGDFMGQRVAIANTDASVVTTSANVRLAVGEPGKDTATVKDAGAVHIFRPLDAAIGAADKELTRGSGLPGTATTRDYTGLALVAGGTNLYVGIPYSKESATNKGVLYVRPWTDVDGTTNTGTTTYQPGANGLPDAGSTFGVIG
ncbi:FG-GAP and VCBS repeat-containing protein [Streptomyces gilvus]|uniref:FG-GAP and VCBS repeat-containing protein n=1 Tax=Streptomyces gilvus TaxID=2920937 RepID=UPI001F0E429D|nr:VCBS repeat-containing protein [Streptomyces sp. CME 23]MCH5674928.1 VCBS repeat-containing protein [Streptomyces sp. CME 23]